MNKNSRVFVTQLPSRRENDAWVPTVNIDAAREHGVIHCILPMGMNYPEADAVCRMLRERLEGFTNEDCLLAIGDPVVMAAAAAILGARGRGFKLLKWDKFSKRYSIFQINP